MAATTNQTLPVGTSVGGRCVIERHLRNGVMTEVYRALREGSGRERFEVRRFTLVASSDALRAVRRELDRIQAMNLPAVPALVDVIDDPVGLLVVTATAAEGATSLRMALDAAGPLDPAECVRIVRVVAGVLDVLHGASPQVLHRRLSPDTITLLGPQREVRVEECGLAQALVDAGLVNARVPLQARQYLSPDELLQRPSPRADIFALASVVFECLTGRPAFLGATEASLSAAILRGVRPSVSALRPEIPGAVDAVLARAWSAEASKGFLSAAALADALATALGVGVPAKPAARPEPAHGSPPAGAPVLSSTELNIMKATILGVGTPSRPPPGPPRAKLSEVEKQALHDPGPMAPFRSRLVGGRPQMPTQKVEVPRIHPPGTERVGEEAERPAFPAARLPPSSAPPKPAPSDRPADADRFNIADIDAFDLPAPPDGTPAGGSAPARASSVPPPIPRVPSRSPTIVRSSVPPAVPAPEPLLVPEPEMPSAEVSFEMDAEIPASVLDDPGMDTWEAPPVPPRPPSMPALPRVSDSAPVSDRAPAPATASVPARVSMPSDPAPVVEIDPDPAPDIDLAPSLEPDPEPSLPVFAIPSEVTPAPSWSPVAAPEPPAFVPVAPQPALDPVSVPAPIAPHFEPPAYAAYSPDRMPDAPQHAPPPSNLTKWKIMGASLVAAAAIVTSGQIYLAKIDRGRDPHRDVPAVLVPTPTPTPALAPAAAVDASPLAVGVDAASLAIPDAAAVPVAADALSVGDAGAATPADAGAVRPAVVVDASAPTAAPGGWDVEVFGADNDPPREHPRRRDMGHLEGELEPEVRRCVGPGSTRHVRMTVVYEGATGRPRDLRIVGAYAQPPVGTCLEALVRAHPVPPFTDEEYESNFVFSTSDDDDE